VTWAKLDDAILDNPKIVRVGIVGFALHVAAITWCARNLTDGFIPAYKVKSLLATEWAEEPGKSKYPPNPNQAGAQAGASPVLPEEADEVLWSLNSGSGYAGRESDATIDGVIRLLVRVGLWSEEFDDRGNFGYQLNDYCEYNPKRADVLAERERKRAAGKGGGKRSGEARAQAPASLVLAPVLPEGARNLRKQKATPVPVPVPVPEEQEPPVVPPGGTGETPTGLSLAPDEPPPPDPVRQVFDHWARVVWSKVSKREAKFTDERRRKIGARLKSYSVADLCAALDRASQSAYHLGQNDSGTVYADIDNLIGSDGKVDKWLASAGGPAQSQPSPALIDHAAISAAAAERRRREWLGDRPPVEPTPGPQLAIGARMAEAAREKSIAVGGGGSK